MLKSAVLVLLLPLVAGSPSLEREGPAKDEELDANKVKGIQALVAPKRPSASIYPVCTSSVIWGDNYQIVHNLIVKHRSIKAMHPDLPHFVLAASDVPALALQLMEEEGMVIKPIDHVEYVAENRESGFAKIMTKMRALELAECEWLVQMDIDMVVLRSITDAVAECEAGGYDLCGVPQSPSCSGRECCMPQGNGNILHVLVVNTGFMVYRPFSGLQQRLFDTLEETNAMREQTLWGEMICLNEDIKVHMLGRKFNIWTDLSWVSDIHVLHYGIGPAYLGADMVPLTNGKVYNYHYGFDYYRRLSLAVDDCAQFLEREECLGEVEEPETGGIEFPSLSIATESDLAVIRLKDSKFYHECTWKADRCVDKRMSALFVEDKDEEMNEIVDANAALHCIIRDNPEGALKMINNCGMFCSYGLHFEDYCDTNFSFFHCIGLMLTFMTDYRAYRTLLIGVWVSCLPKVYVWCLRAGFVLVLLGFCSCMVLLWNVVIRSMDYFCDGLGQAMLRVLPIPCRRTRPHRPSLMKAKVSWNAADVEDGGTMRNSQITQLLANAGKRISGKES